jgi:hypothetical protein
MKKEYHKPKMDKLNIEIKKSWGAFACNYPCPTYEPG